MRAIEQVAGILYQGQPVQELKGAFPFDALAAFIERLVQSLLQCRRPADDAYEYVTYRPRRRPFRDWWFDTSPEERLLDYRISVESRMAQKWNGTPEAFRACCDSIWEAVDSGKLTRAMFHACYAEVRR